MKEIDPERVLKPLADGFKAAQNTSNRFGSAFDPERKEPLDTWIDTGRADRVMDLLEAEAAKTPQFLRGVLVSPAAMERIYDELRDIRRDLEWGAKFHHEANRTHAAGEAQLAGMVSSLINNIVSEDD
jgi:hypothetical protein